MSDTCNEDDDEREVHVDGFHPHPHHRRQQEVVQQCSNNLNKEGNVLFNNTLNTFNLWLYGVRHMVKDHSDSER